MLDGYGSLYSLWVREIITTVNRISVCFAARMAGGALLLAGEILRINIDLFIAAYIIESAALSFLMLSTLGFIGMV
jgi:hypothetical protein